MVIGVVVVTFNCGAMAVDCIKSLQATGGVDLRILVVDNASTDDTVETLVDSELLAADHTEQTLPESIPFAATVLLRKAKNTGFAGGVNAGLRFFMGMEDVDAIWILNPDTTVAPETPAALVACAAQTPDFGIIGGRIVYGSDHNIIQNDGGRVNLWTGICSTVNLFARVDNAPIPDPKTLDFVCGAHMLVSKAFISDIGFMPEEYFLYFEETDWCMRRGDFPIMLAPEAIVYHEGGGSIGSATISQGPSPLSTYFMARSRLRFVARYRPYAVPVAFMYTFAKALRMIFLQGRGKAGVASMRGLFGLPLPKDQRSRLGL